MALGCGVSSASIWDRGGQQFIGAIDMTSLIRYDRQRDDMAEASVVVPSSADCCGLLAQTEPGRHEMVIHRNGERVWEGPINRMTYTAEQTEITAKDVMMYPYRTINTLGYDNTYPHIDFVTNRAAAILRRELQRWEALRPPINVLRYLDVRTTSTTARTSRKTLPYQKTVWEEVDELAARAGMDYTVVGRSIVLFDTHEPVGWTDPVTDSDFLNGVIVSSYGIDLATYSAVTDGEGNYGTYGGTSPYYGRWEILATAYDENNNDGDPPTVAEMRSQAQRNLTGRYPTPVVVRIPDNSQVNPASEALNYSSLVPGTRIPLTATAGCRRVSQDQKLDFVRVNQDETGEQVLVTLSPWPGAGEDFDETGGDDG